MAFFEISDVMPQVVLACLVVVMSVVYLRVFSAGGTTTHTKPVRHTPERQTPKQKQKQKVKGSATGQAPSRPGEASSFKKARLRQEKEDSRTQRRALRAAAARDGAQPPSTSGLIALQVDTLWPLLKASMFHASDNEAPSLSSQRSLKAFFNSAVQGNVSEHDISGIEQAYTLDKFASRADEAASLLMATRCHGAVASEAFPLRVASIGGGPGNDAFGVSVFCSVLAQEGVAVGDVEVVVYDFAEGWRGVVEALDVALRGVEEAPAGTAPLVPTAFSFELCDLRKRADEDVNTHLCANAAGFDYFLFCYCLHESRALEGTLFRDICTLAPKGAVFIIIEVFKRVVQDAASVATECGFTFYDVKSTPDTPFSGGYLVKH